MRKEKTHASRLATIPSTFLPLRDLGTKRGSEGSKYHLPRRDYVYLSRVIGPRGAALADGEYDALDEDDDEAAAFIGKRGNMYDQRGCLLAALKYKLGRVDCRQQEYTRMRSCSEVGDGDPRLEFVK